MDSLLSFPVGLFRPLRHAGLSRRIQDSRPLGSVCAASFGKRTPWASSRIGCLPEGRLGNEGQVLDLRVVQSGLRSVPEEPRDHVGRLNSSRPTRNSERAVNGLAVGFILAAPMARSFPRYAAPRLRQDLAKNKLKTSVFTTRRSARISERIEMYAVGRGTELSSRCPMRRQASMPAHGPWGAPVWRLQH